MDPDVVDALPEFFSLVQMLLDQLGVWTLLMIFLSGVLVVRMGIFVYNMIRS